MEYNIQLFGKTLLIIRFIQTEIRFCISFTFLLHETLFCSLVTFHFLILIPSN